MTQHPIDKLFQDKLKNLEQTPSFNAWDKLENLLDQDQKKGKKNKPYFWAIAACITLLLVSSIFFILSKRNVNHEVVAVKKTLIPQKNQENIKKEESEISVSQENSQIKEDKSLANQTSQKLAEKQTFIKEQNVKNKNIQKEQEIIIENAPKELEKENLITQPIELAQENSKKDTDEPVKLVITLKLAPKENIIQNKPKIEPDFVAKAGNVMTELIHLKNGEEVDYKTLGIAKGKPNGFLFKE